MDRIEWDVCSTTLDKHIKNDLKSSQQNWGKWSIALKKNRTQKNRNILSQIRWCLQELMKGIPGEDYFCSYGWDKPYIANISISCFRNVLSGGILPWTLPAGISKLVWERSQMFHWKVKYVFPKLSLRNLTLYIQNFHSEQRNHEIIKETYLANKLKTGIAREIKFWFSEKFNYILYPQK